jgi:hypothetical protein
MPKRRGTQFGVLDEGRLTEAMSSVEGRAPMRGRRGAHRWGWRGRGGTLGRGGARGGEDKVGGGAQRAGAGEVLLTEEGSRRQGSGEMVRGVEVGGSFSTAITHKGIRRTGRSTWLTTVAAVGPPAHGRAAIERAWGQRLGAVQATPETDKWALTFFIFQDFQTPKLWNSKWGPSLCPNFYKFCRTIF